MTHDPNHPIWADIEGAAHALRHDAEENAQMTKEIYPSITDAGAENRGKHMSEYKFDSQNKLEHRWGTRAGGGAYDSATGSPAPAELFERLNNQGLERPEERVAKVAAKAGKAQRNIDARGEDYETHVFPKGTYYGQEDSNLAVTYYKPTGEMAASMGFNDQGYVYHWASTEGHRHSVAGAASGVAAHNYLKSIGHPTGILHAQTTTDESARVIRSMDPDNTSLLHRSEISSYNEDQAQDMVDRAALMGAPHNISDLQTRPTNEQIARLSDMTGRHPMNFMALSPHKEHRDAAEYSGFGPGAKSRLDPTVLALVNQRAAREDSGIANLNSSAWGRAVRAGRLEQANQGRAQRLANNVAPVAGDVMQHTNGILFWEEQVQRDYQGEVLRNERNRTATPQADVSLDTTSGRSRTNKLQDAGMWVSEEHIPRTTEERLAQDPLARARIIRGKALYDNHPNLF